MGSGEQHGSDTCRCLGQAPSCGSLPQANGWALPNFWGGHKRAGLLSTNLSPAQASPGCHTTTTARETQNPDRACSLPRSFARPRRHSGTREGRAGGASRATCEPLHTGASRSFPEGRWSPRPARWGSRRGTRHPPPLQAAPRPGPALAARSPPPGAYTPHAAKDALWWADGPGGRGGG